MGFLLVVGLASLGAWYLERAQNLTAAARPWVERGRALVVAHPLPSLAVAAAVFVLVVLFVLSRLLRK